MLNAPQSGVFLLTPYAVYRHAGYNVKWKNSTVRRCLTLSFHFAWTSMRHRLTVLLKNCPTTPHVALLHTGLTRMHRLAVLLRYWSCIHYIVTTVFL